MRNDTGGTPPPSRSLLYALPIGVGVMAAVDEIIFHQILQWHHFYDLATPTIGIITDGLLHSAELIAMVAGLFLIVGLARRGVLFRRWAWAGFFLGAGGFQVFDGIVSHKVLRIHQIRYNVDPLMYDIVWNAIGLILIAIGLWLYRQASRNPVGAGRTTGY
ncbi:DUF2243 domain-containing protein [Pseudomonas sp. OIL-1]|uniref:DUF2243 domain-containing protein n=1 Tax=Pseudomonas sp. OIL-1 TaxID=2706126 RepID=UPI0013A76B5F|nr:DUF2243 domain-containing protein [Pseudomonas sp. OIL-1]QIB49746.1 DUF2243 domain-containing protein [Pseudomonas sp. OIL-1]